MKLLVILFAMIMGSQGKDTPSDSISNPTWLEEEWEKSQVELVLEDEGCAKIFIVNMEGELVLTLDEIAINNQLIAPKEYQLYTTSDFLFETADGDKYFLKD